MSLTRTSVNANLVWLAESFSYNYNIDDMSIHSIEETYFLLLVNVVILAILLIQLFVF